MLLPVPLLLGLLGLAAAEPAVYFKEQFLDGGNVWSRLEAVSATRAKPSPPAPSRICPSPVINAERANTSGPGDREPRATACLRP